MKIIRFGKSATGKVSSIKAYQAEEQAEIEVTHIDDAGNQWLKSHGLNSWCIESETGYYLKK